MRVLITNNILSGFGGSEIVCMELAEHFVAAGDDVVLYTNWYADPLASYIESSGLGSRISVAQRGIQDVGSAFDLIWIHHNLIPPEVTSAMAGDGVAAHVIWHHMSRLVPIEFPIFAPVENLIADAVTAVSDAVATMLVRFGIQSAKLRPFNNPAPDEFGQYPALERSPSAGLIRVMVVSNHVPDELSDALAYLAESGVEVRHVGVDGEYQRIRPAMLADADAVITIGKTVQYALSMGIPVFEYDHFGGAGWLLDPALEHEAAWHFSGRDSRGRVDARQIAAELTEGFSEAAAFARAHRETFAERWSLSRNLDAIFQSLPPEPTVKQLRVATAKQFRAFEEWSSGIYQNYEHHRALLEREREQRLHELDASQAERDRLIEAHDALRRERDRLVDGLASLQERSEALRARLEASCEQVHHLGEAVEEMEASTSWRVTKPMRETMRLLRSGLRPAEPHE